MFPFYTTFTIGGIFSPFNVVFFIHLLETENFKIGFDSLSLSLNLITA
jgi:hypothetical protein